jgi:hypothetical protein
MKRFVCPALSFLFVLAWSARAGAATSVTEPAGNPIHVAVDARGVPVPFTVVATGFKPGTLVYVEQCDGRPTTAPNWLPTRDCDIGTSPASVIVDPAGRVQFTEGDRNHGFHPFLGTGPETLFSCLRVNAAVSSKSLVPEYRNCQIRVSTSNYQATDDQVMVPIAFGSAAGSSSSGPSPLVIALLVAVVVAGAVLVFVLLRGRRSQRVS